MSGWDDDDDLLAMLNDDDDAVEAKDANDVVEGGGGEGWDDEIGDLDLSSCGGGGSGGGGNDDDDDAHHRSHPPAHVVHARSEHPNDGSGGMPPPNASMIHDDDANDDENDDDDGGDGTDIGVNERKEGEGEGEEDDEWDMDDDDDIFNEDNVDVDDASSPPYHSHPHPTAMAANDDGCVDGAGGWEEDKSITPSSSTSGLALLRETTVVNATSRPLHRPPPPPPLPPPTSTSPLPPQPRSVGECQPVFRTINDRDPAEDDNIRDDDGGWSDDDYLDNMDEEGDAIISAAPHCPPHCPPPPPPPPLPHAHLGSRSTMTMTTTTTTTTTTKTSISPPVAHRTRSRWSSADDRADASGTTGSSLQPSINDDNDDPARGGILHALSTYVSSLHDPKLPERLHRKLHQHRASTPGSAASDLRSYYASRPGLREYTLGVELDRMDYELILPNDGGGRGGVTVIHDPDEVRLYFGAEADGKRRRTKATGGGEEDFATTEELLIRSANQSLLADMLAELSISEEGYFSSSDNAIEDGGMDVIRRTGLLLSGPILCMTSVAEACKFRIDLRSGFVEAMCSLAVSVPYHRHETVDNGAGEEDDDDNWAASSSSNDGRLVLARAEVSVRFRPGGEGDNDVINDEPTVQYAVRSLTPYHAPDSALLRNVAASLARDHRDDPFLDLHADGSVVDDDDDAGAVVDARDRFLLSHRLADSGMLVVSDRIDRLRGAALAKTTGFRSALRQLDGVTNVSSKLQGLGRFGLSLPSAEEIEAAEREEFEAVNVHYPPHPPPPKSAEFCFPRPSDVIGDDPSRFPPRPPPPPPMPQKTEASSRPRPLISGLLMSGLSRLAAATTNPDEQKAGRSAWEDDGVRTGSTPYPASSLLGSDCSGHLTPYPREKVEYHPDGEPKGRMGLTTLEDQQPLRQHSTHSLRTSMVDVGHNDMLCGEEYDSPEEVIEDAGWSDDEFDYEDGGNDSELEEERCVIENKLEIVNKGNTGSSVQTTHGVQRDKPFEEKESVHETTRKNVNHQPLISGQTTLSLRGMTKPPPPPPPSQRQQPSSTHCHSHTFEEEFVIVLREKNEAELQGMKKSGRMKRWNPISEDPVLRQRLMDVMVAQIQS